MTINQFIYHPFIITPLIFLGLALCPAKSKFYSILNILIVALYTFLIYKEVQWPDYGSYYLRYLYVFLFSITCIKPIRRFSQLPFLSEKNSWKWVLRVWGSIKIISLLFLLLIISRMYISTSEQSKKFDIDFPLKNGTYYITNQHTDFRERYAYDITKLNIWGRKWNNSFFRPDELDHYNIFKDTIYSPCNGRISEVNQQQPDHGIGDLNMFQIPPNKVVINQGDKSIELLHLLQNSVFVNVGDSVITGQAIALVGNSGKSKYPHLHINAYRNDVLLQYYPSIEISFNTPKTNNTIIFQK